MEGRCITSEHISRRAALKGTLATAAGALVPNWGGLFGAEAAVAAAARQGKRCILLWMAGGASQLDTFDMKPGQNTGGPFREISTNVPGMKVCEYLPGMARHADKLAVIKSMKTKEPDHPRATYAMHTGYKPEVGVNHPELGSMVARYVPSGADDLPSFVQMAPGGQSGPNAGAGYLGPRYQPFKMGTDGRMPSFTSGYAKPDEEAARADLLRFMNGRFTEARKADPFGAHVDAKERAWRLMKAKEAFDVEAEWQKCRDLYGDSKFGRGCMLARRLVERGVPFVEVGQHGYDTHADNFSGHKALLQVLDKAWSGLLQDLQQRGLLEQTLVVWMGEVGRTPQINNRAGRDHFVNGWTVVMSGGGTRGGVSYGRTSADGREVAENPVSEGDLFSTIYTLLGVNPRVKHFVGTRPVWATPEDAKVVKEVIA
jgi:hypothetical protein